MPLSARVLLSRPVFLGTGQTRSFSVSASRSAQYGFIGLGQMGEWNCLLTALSMLTVEIGYNMALNLQSKLPSTDTLLIQDINTEATKRFLAEVEAAQPGGAAVRIANSVREATDESVCTANMFSILCKSVCSIFTFSFVMSLFYL